MRRQAVIFSTLAIMAVVGTAQAATVNVKSGSVFIDRGDGYKPVTGSTVGSDGHVVMAMAGGSGEIVYDDGCRQAVEVGAVVVIGPASPCAAASPGGVDYTLVIGGLVVAGGVAAAIALSGDDDPASK